MSERLSPLASPSATRALLEEHGLHTKKALGQNFLINDAILHKIVDLAELSADDVVLEVGPGIGTLTIALLKTAGQVISVERDTDLPAVLAQSCAPWAERFTLLNKDALGLEPDELPTAPNKFVSNLPYAVAATLTLDAFERFSSIECATVMVQAEVADRMAATVGNKSYGAYTVKLQLRAVPAGRFSVSPGNFFPPPRVESSVIRLDRFDRGLTDEELAAASLMADASFATRRKTIANSCKTYFAGRGALGAEAASHLLDVFDDAGVSPTVRGETLAVEDYIRLGQSYLRLVGALLSQ